MVLCLLLLEGFIQWNESKNFFMQNALGDLVANQSVCRFSEGFYFGATNNVGHLGPDYYPKTSEDTIYMALYGDSFVMGGQVPDNSQFRHLLEEKLNTVSKKPVKVYNFGVFGANAGNMFYTYKKYGLDTLMDLNIFVLTEYKFLKNYKSETKAYLKWEKDTIQLVKNHINPIEIYLSQCSRLITLTYAMQKNIKRKMEKAGLLYKKPIDFNLNYTSPLNEYMINDLKSRSNNLFVLRREGDKDSLLYKHLNAVFQFQSYIDDQPYDYYNLTYFKVTKGQGHFNKMGHQAMADFLFEVITKEKAFPNGEGF